MAAMQFMDTRIMQGTATLPEGAEKFTYMLAADRRGESSPAKRILVIGVLHVERNVALDKSPLAIALLKNVVVAAGRTDGGNAGTVRHSGARAHGEPVGMVLDAGRAQELVR